MSSMKHIVMSCIAAVALAAFAYLPPVEERCGVKVEIGSFPQKIERNNKNPFAWPLGVTEVQAGAPRAFPVTLENKTEKSVSGELEVWMNDDWDVAGPQGLLTLAPGEKKELAYTGTARPRALNALYPVHARFTPAGTKKEDAPHPIAVFMYKNPNAPRPVRKVATPKLGPGAFSLDAGFARSTFIEVKGKVMAVDPDGAPKEWGAHMAKGRPSPRGEAKAGFSTHPPYKKGAGFIWSDFPLDLPDVTPLAFSCSNYLVDNHGQPPSDGAEDKVFVVIHGYTNHGPAYNTNYPPEFEVFTPVSSTVEMSKVSREELFNAYDNSIVYQDWIVHSVIETVRSIPDRRGCVLFVSDHGESLGENNLYMHGVPFSMAPREQIEIPFLVWTSDPSLSVKRLDKVGQHHVFHSVLSFFGVESPAFDASKSIFEIVNDSELWH